MNGNYSVYKESYPVLIPRSLYCSVVFTQILYERLLNIRTFEFDWEAFLKNFNVKSEK